MICYQVYHDMFISRILDFHTTFSAIPKQNKKYNKTSSYSYPLYYAGFTHNIRYFDKKHEIV